MPLLYRNPNTPFKGSQAMKTTMILYLGALVAFAITAGVPSSSPTNKGC
jgi:hypothetical protein